jgi:hypothetical protein
MMQRRDMFMIRHPVELWYATVHRNRRALRSLAGLSWMDIFGGQANNGRVEYILVIKLQRQAMRGKRSASRTLPYVSLRFPTIPSHRARGRVSDSNRRISLSKTFPCVSPHFPSSVVHSAHLSDGGGDHMHIAKRLTIDSSLIPRRPSMDLAEQRRRLGRVCLLILNYDPQKKASQNRVNEVVPQSD